MGIDVVEASVASLRAALEAGETTSEELVRAYLARIEAYDSAGPRLNAVVVPNPATLDDARASDARRAKGETLGPLDGIPYTAKDSYLATGLTCASGSPAFADLVAQRRFGMGVEQAMWTSPLYVVRSDQGLPRRRIYLRGRAQETWGDFPARGDTMDVRITCIEPKSEGRGVRRSREIGQQILDVLQPHRQTHQAVADAGDRALFRRHGGVGHGGWMGDQAFHAAK